MFGGDGLFQRFVRCGDDAHVRSDGLVAADPFERAGLQHAQNFCLRRQRHVADFIQKNRALVALFECANPLAVGARERAFLVSEKFALQKILRDGRAVDREKGPAVPSAVMVYRPCYQFLSGAALTGDEGRGIGTGELSDEFKNVLHRFATAHDAKVVVLRFEQRLIGNDLFHVARGFQRGGNDLLQFRHVEWFEQIIVGAQLHRFNGHLRRAVGSHHDDRQFFVGLANAPQGFQTVHSAHPHVHNDQVWLHLGNQFQPFFPAGGSGQLNFR